MKQILFNTEMVLAILDGQKTVTRRAINGKGELYPGETVEEWAKRWNEKPPYQVGDILYVRETWTYHDGAVGGIIFKARCPKKLADSKKWKPSIHMPKKAARIFLRVTNVRAERLQDIDCEQAKAEGANWKNGKNVGYEEKMRRDAVERFAEIWNSTMKKSDREDYGWDANPFVWVVEFERCEKPEEE